MFYEENKISNALDCAKCEERLVDPRILPCGDTICLTCQSTLHVDNKLFECISCIKTHSMPDEGLPVNKGLQALLSLQPDEVSRGPAAENLKESMSEMRKKVTALFFCINNGPDKVKDLCAQLRNDVQLATEQAIQQINLFNEEMIAEIDQYEKDAIRSYHPNKEEANKTVKELESFQSKWQEYLKQSQLSHDQVLKANAEAAKLVERADDELFNLDSLLFSDGSLKFTKNPFKLEKKSLGSFELEEMQRVESTILSFRQMKQLFLKLMRMHSYLVLLTKIIGH